MTGTVRLDCFIVIAAGVPLARITSGASRSNGAAADCTNRRRQAPLKIDLNIAAGRPAELLESLPERRGAGLSFRIILGVEHQHADPPHPLALLRVRRERPRRRAAEKGDELAPL